MSYQKHNWITREIIRRQLLQNIEDGIYNEQERAIAAEVELGAALSTETSRAVEKENQLNASIVNVNNALTSEVSRATTKENNLQTSISNETTRATGVEGQLSTNISNVSSSLSTEVSRAMSAEATLQGNIDSEETRASAAEATLSSNIAAERTRAQNAESDLHDYVDQQITRTYKPSGSIYFAELPTLSASRLGNVYDIKDAFTTTSDFAEGAGKSYPAGTNVAIVDIGSGTYKYDCMPGSNVIGVKGDSESNYRTGQVNITKANIGLGNVPNVTTNNQTPTFTEASTRANIASGETLSVLFGKIMKFFTDLKTVAFSGSYSDLSNKPTIGNATLTIQKNGTAVDTFTANATTNKTINITMAKSDVGLGNVGNYKAVSTVANQGLSDTEKANARANIGAGSATGGTVTKVATGAGLTGGDITTTGTVKAKLKSETLSLLTAAARGSTSDREYPIGLDADGNLSVNVPWTNTTYTPQKLGFGYATCSTAAATTAKVATLTDYDLVKNGYVSVKFTNSVPANATLNVNSKGAKAIYYHGAAITAGVIGAGDLATFVYDGTNYHLVGLDSNNRVLYFTGQACAATTGNFCTINNSLITENHVVTACTFSKPSAITTDVLCTSSNGSLVLNGTCTDATCTVDITLIKKDN